MYSLFKLSLVLAFSLAFVFDIPVFAGGWAVITLDALPSGVVAGESITVGFTVLQHGRTPLTGIDATITARPGFEELLFVAKPEGKPGHYIVTMTFPDVG